MRDGTQRIAGNIHGSGCNAARAGSGEPERPADMTSNVHSASRQRERARQSECDGQCYCGEFHDCLLCCCLDGETTAAFVLSFPKFVFKMEAARPLPSRTASPLEVLRVTRSLA